MMSHGPAAPSGKDFAADYKMKLGVKLFVVYALIYAGFVLINVVWPMMMDQVVLFGLNLACVYGFGLIGLAAVLAVVYDAMCRRQESLLNKEGEVH